MGLIKGWIVKGLNTSAIIAAAILHAEAFVSPEKGWETTAPLPGHKSHNPGLLPSFFGCVLFFSNLFLGMGRGGERRQV